MKISSNQFTIESLVCNEASINPTMQEGEVETVEVSERDITGRETTRCPSNTMCCLNIAIMIISGIALVLNAFAKHYAYVGWVVGPSLILISIMGVSVSRSEWCIRNNSLKVIFLFIECMLVVFGGFYWFIFLYSDLNNHKVC